MSKILELRNKRNTLWEQTKAFLEEHRDESGLVAADAVEQYNKMAADVKALGEEITRLEDQICMKRSAFYTLRCHHCGKEFVSYGNNKRKYCSHECYIEERFGAAALPGSEGTV